jgi:hypothetical protein
MPARHSRATARGGAWADVSAACASTLRWHDPAPAADPGVRPDGLPHGRRAGRGCGTGADGDRGSSGAGSGGGVAAGRRRRSNAAMASIHCGRSSTTARTAPGNRWRSYCAPGTPGRTRPPTTSRWSAARCGSYRRTGPEPVRAGGCWCARTPPAAPMSSWTGWSDSGCPTRSGSACRPTSSTS